MSIRMCRLRPLIFLPRRSPKDQAQTPFLSALRGLRVDDRHRRANATNARARARTCDQAA